MRFKEWILNEEQEIQQPYYRVVNGTMYGASAKDPTGPGTYWTPRWDSVLMMLGSTLKYHKQGDTLGDKWKTTVYQLDKAVMTDPPKEHAWAFTYGVDAGEQVLVKALEKPKIAKNPNTGKEIKDLMPSDPDFLELMIGATNQKPPVDWERRGVKANLDGKEVFLGWDYDDRTITAYEKKGWEFKPVLTINGYKQWNDLSSRLKVEDPHGEAMDGLQWFMVDMDKDAREGDRRAAQWSLPWDEG